MKAAIRRAFMTAAFAAGTLGLQAASDSAVRDEKTIAITAERFNYSPSQITVKKGEPVVLELTSKDVVMGLALPDFDVHADIVPGKVTRVRFQPDKAGSFIFLCNVFCGSGHEAMNGKLVVVE